MAGRSRAARGRRAIAPAVAAAWRNTAPTLPRSRRAGGPRPSILCRSSSARSGGRRSQSSRNCVLAEAARATCGGSVHRSGHGREYLAHNAGLVVRREALTRRPPSPEGRGGKDVARQCAAGRAARMAQHRMPCPFAALPDRAGRVARAPATAHHRRLENFAGDEVSHFPPAPSPRGRGRRRYAISFPPASPVGRRARGVRSRRRLPQLRAEEARRCARNHRRAEPNAIGRDADRAARGCRGRRRNG